MPTVICGGDFAAISAKSLGHPVIVDGHAAEDLVVTL
jgi:hypothetical protein